jgi:ribosomal-protein-alanine N-acetyltransferase
MIDLLRQPETVADAALEPTGKGLMGFAISRSLLPEAELLTIAVDRTHHKRGVGKALLAAHFRRLSATGAREVFLEVDEANFSAIKLYGSFGFQQVGFRSGYYPKPDGKRANGLVLRAGLD